MTDYERALQRIERDAQRGNQLWDPWAETRFTVRQLEDVANVSHPPDFARLRQAA